MLGRGGPALSLPIKGYSFRYDGQTKGRSGGISQMGFMDRQFYRTLVKLDANSAQFL